MDWTYVAEFLKDFQDHGGIVAAVLMVGLVFLFVRSFDWLKWRHELSTVAKNASADVGQHELNFHEDEIFLNATEERLLELQKRLSDRIKERKLKSVWTGEERRSA